MLDEIFKKLIPESMKKNVMDYTYAKNVVGCGIITAIAAPAFALVYYFLNFSLGSCVVILVGLIVAATVLLFKYINSLFVVREIILITVFALFAWLSYRIGGMTSPATFWFCLPPLLAIMMGSKKSGYFWCLLCVTAVVILFMASYMHIALPLSPITHPYFLMAFSIGALIICVLFNAYFFERATREGAIEFQEKNIRLMQDKIKAENTEQRAKEVNLAKSAVLAKICKDADDADQTMNSLRILRSAPDCYLILNPELKILEVSDAYLQATMVRRDEIIGYNIFEIFPDNPNDPEATGVRNLSASMETVLKTKKPHTMPIQKYDIRRPDGDFEVRYWSPVNSPVFDANNEIQYIIHRAEDVTKLIQLEEDGVKQQQRAEELSSRAGQMETEIYRRSQELRETNLRLEDAIHQSERLAQKAQEASHVKSAFLSTMSHETRTPLNGVLGMTSLLMDTTLAPEQREWVEVIRKSGEDLLSIINNILEFSKIESEHAALEDTDFVLRPLLDEVVELISSETRAKGILVNTRIDDNVPEVFTGDSSRLRQILSILLINAMKFTDHGKISTHIGLVKKDGYKVTLRVEVADTGIGLAKGVRKRLFQQFSQGDSSSSRKYGGMGLGLAIAMRLVESMEGSIDVESKEGKGCRFWFTVQLNVCHKAAIDIQPNKAQSMIQTRLNNLSKEAKKARVLLAEDNPMNQKVNKLLLNKLGYHVDVVSNGLEVLYAIQTVPYDIILMDCEMPEMDGYEATREIRRLEHSQGKQHHIPVIALTSYVLQEDRDKCISAGMDDFLAKPVNRNLLGSILEIWLHQKNDYL